VQVPPKPGAMLAARARAAQLRLASAVVPRDFITATTNSTARSRRHPLSSLTGAAPLPLATVDAFTSSPGAAYTGNPAAVCLLPANSKVSRLVQRRPMAGLLPRSVLGVSCITTYHD
jgi:hypothetical protein